MDNDRRRDNDLNERDDVSDHCWSEPEEFGLEAPCDDLDNEVESIEEPSPETRWEDLLRREPEADRLQQLIEALVALGCNKGELLQALFRVWSAHIYWAAPRSRLVERTELMPIAYRLTSYETLHNRFNRAKSVYPTESSTLSIGQSISICRPDRLRLTCTRPSSLNAFFSFISACQISMYAVSA